MGRIADLCSDVVEAADEGPDGSYQLSVEARAQLRGQWSDADIEDALDLVNAQSRQNDLVDAADSLSARLLELLGTWGEARAWTAAVEGHARISIDVIRQLAHRLDHLEEVLERCRDQKAPDRRAFDALQRRLMDQGIEDEMRPDWEKHGQGGAGDEP